MVLFEWLRDSRHPKFREVQKLLKWAAPSPASTTASMTAATRYHVVALI